LEINQGYTMMHGQPTIKKNIVEKIFSKDVLVYLCTET